MYYISTLKRELSPAKIDEHSRLNETSVVDGHRCHIATKLSVFVDEGHSIRFLLYTGYLNFINDHINPVLLLMLVHVLLPSCLYV